MKTLIALLILASSSVHSADLVMGDDTNRIVLTDAPCQLLQFLQQLDHIADPGKMINERFADAGKPIDHIPDAGKMVTPDQFADAGNMVYRAYAVGVDGEGEPAVFEGCWQRLAAPEGMSKEVNNEHYTVKPAERVIITTDMGMTFNRPISDFRVMEDAYAKF
jgi:hypothetical protein